MTTVTGPSSSTVGNIAFFDNTSGSSIGAAPAFQSGNPGNAAIYSTLANPANGYTVIYNGMQFSLGNPVPASEQNAPGNIYGMQQAIVGTLDLAPGDSSGGGSGVSGYARARTNSWTIGGGAVGVIGSGTCEIDNSNCWGANFIAQNAPVSSFVGFNPNSMIATEVNVNTWKVSGGADPTFGFLYGVLLQGSGDNTTDMGKGYVLGALNLSTGAKWSDGFISMAGATNNAFVAGPAAAGANQPSQYMIFRSTDAGNITREAAVRSDAAGSLYLLPSPGQYNVTEDGNGAVLMLSGAALGGSHVALPALTSAGVVTNDASGVLSSSTTLPSALTLPNPTLSGTITTQGSIVPSLSAGTPIIDSSGTTISLGAGASGLIANNVACEIAIREASFTGELASFLLGPFGVAAPVRQSGSDWSLGTSPPSTGFSIGYDGGSNTWKLYNGSGAARTFSFALTRFG